ncbi:hypothetical protein V8G54_017303, partial [Vigna mungo]
KIENPKIKNAYHLTSRPRRAHPHTHSSSTSRRSEPAAAQAHSSEATIAVHSTHSSQAHFGCLKCSITVFKAERTHYMEDSARQEKVRKYEEFVDKRLKPDLIHAISQRADLRRNIENLEKNSVTSLRTLVNLGSEVYLQAEVHRSTATPLLLLGTINGRRFKLRETSPSILVQLVHLPDTQRIFVDIGFGFHVEFTWSEALNYIDKREEKIARYKF